MKVSVIILCYNNLKYINEAIQSLLIQTYKNFELIIADDGSFDFDERKITNLLCCHDFDVILYSNTNNMGTVKNINKAISKCTGDTITILACDDVFYDCNVIENIVKSFELLSLDDHVLTSQTVNCTTDLLTQKSPTMNDENIQALQSGDFNQLYSELALSCFITSGGTSYRRAFFERYWKFDERYRLVEDWPMFLKLARNKIKIHFFDFISIKHRDGGVSHSGLYTDTQRQYQKDMVEIINDEILSNINFCQDSLKNKVFIQCNDKLKIYKSRYEKTNLLYKMKLVPVIIRGVKRRYGKK